MKSDKLERLYMAYRRLMYYAAYKILQNESDAEDAVQAAFESILRNIDKIEKPDSPQARAYVTLTAERKAIDILRSRSGAAFEELDEKVPVVPPPGTTVWQTPWRGSPPGTGRCFSCGSTTGMGAVRSRRFWVSGKTPCKSSSSAPARSLQTY